MSSSFFFPCLLSCKRNSSELNCALYKINWNYFFMTIAYLSSISCRCPSDSWWSIKSWSFIFIHWYVIWFMTVFAYIIFFCWDIVSLIYAFGNVLYLYILYITVDFCNYFSHDIAVGLNIVIVCDIVIILQKINNKISY